MRTRTYARPVTAGILTAALVGTGLTGAIAAEDPTESTAQLIADVAPDQGQVVAGALQNGAVTTQAQDTAAVISLDPNQPITLGTGSEGIQVNLPEEIAVADGKVASDGTVVYQATDGGADAAVQALHDGSVRVQTITPDASGPHEFTYTFGDGAQIVDTADGGIAVVTDAGDGTFTAAVLEDAWARDASGAEVASHYEIDGDALVQVIEPTSQTAYPVVADPKWKWYAGAWSAKFNRSETRQLAVAGGAAAMCGALAKMAPNLAVICGVYGGYIFSQAAIANTNNACIAITATPPPLVFRYKDNDCK
ncbi:hypothetical protein MT994_03550 [Cellulosimicrobium sp. MI9406]|uniref:hypothetical protein n=1 Tax=Cellulosimicrobium sp. MI9406 TaxID=2931398 RepID=UPI0005DDACA0|nr:Uncharacterised protein [Mycobacteroides abscessus]